MRVLSHHPTVRLALAACLVITAACGGERRPGGPNPTSAPAGDTAAFRPLSVGDPAPVYAVARLTLAGAPADTLRVGGAGQPVTLVNVWATWCTSCREEMGDLEALHREFGPRGLRVVGVSVDNGPEARVRRFAERERLTFALAHDPEGRVQDAFRVVGVPETYLVDGAGRVRWARAGNVHGVLGEARGAIAEALGGGGSTGTRQ